MKLMIMLLISLFLATGVEGYKEKRCKHIKRKWEKYEKKSEKNCSPSPP